MQEVSIHKESSERYRISLSDATTIEVNGDEPRSTDLVLAGLAACSARTLGIVLARMRIDVHDVNLKVSAERKEEPPRVFTRINMYWAVSSQTTPKAKILRALALAESHCTVFNILKAGTEIEVHLDVDAPD